MASYLHGYGSWNTKLHKSLASWAISKLDFGKEIGRNTDKYLIQSCVSPWAMYSGWEQNAGPLRYVTVSPIPMSLLRIQSFTSKMKNQSQEINRSYAFCGFLNHGIFPWRNCSINTLVH